MVMLTGYQEIDDFGRLWQIIYNAMAQPFYLGGFELSWLAILLYSLIGSLLIGAVVHIFKSHE